MSPPGTEPPLPPPPSSPVLPPVLFQFSVPHTQENGNGFSPCAPVGSGRAEEFAPAGGRVEQRGVVVADLGRVV